jgi:phosphatidylglycerophosphate synthase
MNNTHETELHERRPITSRERPAAQRFATWVGRTGLSPNAISVLGLAFGVTAGILLALTTSAWASERLLWILAAVLVQLRLLANMVDGMVAVETGAASPLGELYNEVPDRVSDTAVFVGLGYATGGLPWLGYTVALLAMFTAYVRATGSVAGAPQDYGGPLAKPQRMFLVTLLALYCGLAPAAWQPTLSADPSIGLAAAALGFLALGTLLTALRRLQRIAGGLRAAT